MCRETGQKCESDCEIYIKEQEQYENRITNVTSEDKKHPMREGNNFYFHGWLVD